MFKILVLVSRSITNVSSGFCGLLIIKRFVYQMWTKMETRIVCIFPLSTTRCFNRATGRLEKNLVVLKL